MLFTLVVLLTFALLITLAGFFLTFKSRDVSARAMNTLVRSRDPVTEQIVNPRYRRVVRDSGREERSRQTTAVLLSPRGARALSISTWGAGLSLGRRGSGDRIPASMFVIGLVSVCILAIFAFNALFPHAAMLVPTWFADSSAPPKQPASQPTQFYGASKALKRIGQLDPAQYNSIQDYDIWAYSACSAAAMTEVFDAYGRSYRIADVLKVEASINAITPSLGLVDDAGIQRTATLFGFTTSWGYSRSLAQVIAIANSGEPVIVGWPPSKYPEGHLLVVIGGNSTTVYLADSSWYDRTSLTHAQFMNWWAGYSALVTPNQ